MIRPALAPLALIVFVLLAGCDDATAPVEPAVAVGIAPSAGGGWTG